MKKLLLIAALALLTPQYALAQEHMDDMDMEDMGFWEEAEMLPMQHDIPYILNYQITPDGARIFGILSNATNGVEVFDNGVSLGGRLESLPNSVFSLELDRPLDVNQDHNITLRGWDVHNEPVKIDSPYISNEEGTQVTVNFSIEQLQEQKRVYDVEAAGKKVDSQTPSSTPSAVTPIPGGGTNTGDQDDQSKNWLWMVITFLVIFAIGLIFYFLSKKRRGGKDHDGEGHTGVHGSP